MDGGRPTAAQWRSSIPGVWQQEGAPATLGVVAWGVPGSATAGALEGEAAGGRGNSLDGGGLPSGRTGRAHGRRRRPWRALALAGLALVAVVGVVRVAGAVADDAGPGSGPGWELTAEPSATAKPSPTAEPSATAKPSATAEPSPVGPYAVDDRSGESPDWWEVLAELDRRRARALTALDTDLIEDYAEPGSAAWESDAALVGDLRARGLRPQGLTSRVLAVERSERRGGQAQVQVVDQRSAYTLVDAHGLVVESVPQARLTRWSVTLAEATRDPLGWRVVEVASTQGSEASAEPSGEREPSPEPSGELEP